MRGVSGLVAEGPYAWGFIFRRGVFGKPISIESTDTDGRRLRLEVGLSESQAVSHEQAANENGAGVSRIIPTDAVPAPSLELKYFSSNIAGAPDTVSRIRLGQDQSVIESAPRMPLRPSSFLANHPGDARLDAQRFSRLVELRRAQDVVTALRQLEPRLSELTVLAQPSGPTVAADVGPGALIPTSYMGRGFERLLSIVLAIMLSAGGTVLIDEIDAGLHYGVLSDAWHIVVSLAIEQSVQVFATTHSYECIQAAVKGSEAHEGSLAFYRLEREGDEVEVVQGSDSRLRSAIAVGFELR
jgi:hypothetical protein